MNNILKTAKSLYDIGFAIHWLREKSKIPLEGGWGSGPRKEWSYLEKTYSPGLNVGVRLGTPSKIKNGYLAVVDIDVKSSNKRHLEEAMRAAESVLGKSIHISATVSSGRGNGSRHYYCITKEPFKTWNPAASSETIKVHMPSKKPSQKEIESLSAKEIGEGIRLARAWEVSLYSDGRQVVLPPSIHPDSGKPYKWTRPPVGGALPLVEFKKPAAAPSVNSVKTVATSEAYNSDFVKVDLEWLPISDKVRDAIILGTGVENRSDYMLFAATALHSAGLTKDEIVSVLTDSRYWLSSCAYDHAKTKDRRRAAEWVWTYTVKKVMAEKDPTSVFNVPVERATPISAEAYKAQNAALEAEVDWRHDIIRTGAKGDGPPKACVENVVLILTKGVGERLATRNFFALRDTYGMDAPWGGKRGDLINDDDVVEIKYWLGRKWRFEPNNNTISEALIIIARKNGYDPVVDFLNALPVWDGVKRLGTWLRNHFEAEGEPEYLSQVFTKWMVAIVMRAKMPGSKFDWFPIFEGPQGVGKSSFGRLLVGDEFFLDNLPPLADKDSALALQGIWAVELGELANMRKTEIEIVKAYITRTVDKVRAPYGKRWQENPRRCVFFGTTNRSTYLTDDTGNRRIKPCKVGRLDFECLRKERLQLFAEALAIYNELKTGERRIERYFELTGAAAEFEAKIHQEKMVEDDSAIMIEQLQKFFEKKFFETKGLPKEEAAKIFDFDRFSLLELFEGIGPLRNWSPHNRNVQFAGKALKMMGAQSRKIKGLKVWKMPEGDRFLDEPIPPDFY